LKKQYDISIDYNQHSCEGEIDKHMYGCFNNMWFEHFHRW